MSELISKFGADSKIGIMAAIMTTSTETTFYTLAIYTGGKRIEGMWKILVSALLADITAVAAAVTYVNFFE
jgi:spore maturation protein B